MTHQQMPDNSGQVDKIDVLDKGHVMLLRAMPITGGDRVIVETALKTRGHKIKNDEHIRRVIKTLIEKRHTKPFEFVEFHFEIKCPIFVARQMRTHRTWVRLEESRRHLTTDPEFYLPVSNCSNRVYVASYQMSFATYKDLLTRGEPPEQARIVLPFAMYTTYDGKVNAKNLLDFLRQRLAKDAQWETRQYAIALHTLFAQVLPVTADVVRWTKWQ